MIFSNDKNSQKFKVKLDGFRLTKQGGLRVRATVADHPEDEPGYITFNSKEVVRIKKLLAKLE